MSIFTSIRNVLRPTHPTQTPRAFTLPYDLTNEEWSALKTLTSDRGWPAFVGALDSLAKLKGEQILQTSNVEALHFMRGYVAGLRKAGTLVDEISLMEQRFARESERPKSAATERPRDVLFGSPGWRPPRARDAS